ncbi:MAG: MFS transporter [Actinomycetota bacterium]|nr:MFS transporter [Actinomycetota bacterium]
MTVENHDASDGPADPSRRRDLPAAVWALVVARAVNRLGAFTLPFLAVILHDELSASLSTAGLVVAVFGVATIPSRLAGGELADRIGPVMTITLGLVGCAGAQLWVAGSRSLVSVMGAVVLLGLAFELYEPPSQALVADLTPERDRAAAYGLLSAALAGAGAGAGLLATWLGRLDLRWLFVADAVSCLAAAVLVLTVVRPHLASASRGSPERGDPDAGVGVGPWRDPRLRLLLAAGTAFAITYLTLVTALPLTLGSRGIAPVRAGLLLTTSALTVVAGQPLLHWAPLQRPARALTAGYVALAAGLLATGTSTTLVGFVAATVLWSVGDLLLLGHAWTLVAGIAPAGARGRYLAAYGMSWGVASVVAPILATQLLAARGPLLLWGALAAVALALAAAQPALVTRCHSPGRPARG